LNSAIKSEQWTVSRNTRRSVLLFGDTDYIHTYFLKIMRFHSVIHKSRTQLFSTVDIKSQVAKDSNYFNIKTGFTHILVWIKSVECCKK